MREAMCRNLAKKGSWKVVGFDTQAGPLDRLSEDGVMRTSSVEDLVAQSDVVLLCLPGGNEVRSVTIGDKGLIQWVRKGQTVVDMSTAPPKLMRELEPLFRAKGADFADAPVARTRRAAVDGTLSIMVGGTADVFERIRPVLSTMGTEVTHCGGMGAGQVVKLMNNMVVFETTMAKGSADSFVLRNHGMKHLVPQDYPEQAFSVRYAVKDLSYARELARETGVTARAADLVGELFEEAIARGDGDRYTPVIRRGMTKS